jgi:hypothetical protein
MLQLPRCRHCQRLWKPRSDVVASRAYCSRCRADRRKIAQQAFELRPLTAEDLRGPFAPVRRKAR